MVVRRPLVLVSGLVSELPSGDSALAGTSATEIVAGSGLDGGGPISSIPRLDVSLAPNPSGIIFVDGALANDGVAYAEAELALASGSEGAYIGYLAEASGEAAVSGSTAALASGNAALALVVGAGEGGTRYTGTAAATITKGSPLGINDAGEIEPIRRDEFIRRQPTTGPFDLWSEYTRTDIDSITYSPAVKKFFINHDGRYPWALTGEVTGNGTWALGYGMNQYVGTQSYFRNYYTVYNPVLDEFVTTYELQSNNSIYAQVFKFEENGSRIVDATSTILVASSSNGFNYGVVWLEDNIYCSLYEDGSLNLYLQIFRASSAGGTRDTDGLYRVAYYNTTNQWMTYDRKRKCIIVGFNDDDSKHRIALFQFDVDQSAIFDRGTWPLNYEGSMTYPNISFDKRKDRYVLAGGFTPNGGKLTFYPFTLNDNLTLTQPLPSGQVLDPYQVSNAYDRVVYDDVTDVYACLFRAYGSSTHTLTVTSSGDNHFFVSDSGIAYADSGPSNIVGAFDPESQQAIFTIDHDNNRMLKTCTHNYFQGNNCIPQAGTYSNFIGLAATEAASGESVVVVLPGDQYVYDSGNFTVGAPLYLDIISSGLREESNLEPTWSGQVAWAPVARATSSSGVVLINQL
jgi:hypothetical protein